ncbi:MAG: OsmC family protein [Candidatus Sumerlaeaceae bacterium]|nr:OsmC family protein [Candidatus Sumerlaeaceae bacterium]
MTTATQQQIVNGLDTAAIRATIEDVAAHPEKGQTKWAVTTEWKGGTRSDARATYCEIGGQRIAKDFTLRADEPIELCGTNQFANPQEFLMAGLNACMTVGYVMTCAMNGIELEELRIETEGNIDLRGMFQLSDKVPVGYDSLRYTVHIKGKATPEEFQKVHETVMATSPNYFNLANAIAMKSRLVVK